MSTPQYPSVEVIQRGDVAEGAAPGSGRRWKVFVPVLAIAAAAGLAYVYSRTPVYRASASVLTVQPKAVDRPSAAADVQHVALQERLLLGEALLERLAQRLRASEAAAPLDPGALRTMLSVDSVPDTNLLELRAQGERPLQLQRVVNEWAGTYEVLRREEVENEAGRTNAQLVGEQHELEAKIEAARAELAAFRDAHDIVSLEREENRKISALKGINRSLNDAREQLVKARARQAAVDEAIARGDTVVPPEQKSELAKLRAVIARESATLAALQARYTDTYIARDPKHRDLPETLDAHRQELAALLDVGRSTVRDEARQATEAARAAVEALERQLDADQARVQQFTERFNEFKVLEERLASLERLHAERAQRLTEIDVTDERRFPPLKVVERARVPSEPISPDYDRDRNIALAAALGIALFVTWLVEYLSAGAPRAAPSPALGVRISHGPGPPALAHDASGHRLLRDAAHPAPLPAIPGPGAGARAPAGLRELSVREAQALLARLDPLTGALAALLLSGVAPYELVLLDGDAFDRRGRRVSVPGAARRTLVLDAAAWRWIEPLLEAPQAMPSLLLDLDRALADAAFAARLRDPGEVTGLVLWHTCAAYLVQQGIDDAALRARVGGLPHAVAHALEASRPAASEPPASVDYTYPALRAGAST